MKKRRFAQLVLMITMLFCLTFGTVCAQAATTAALLLPKAALPRALWWKRAAPKPLRKVPRLPKKALKAAPRPLCFPTTSTWLPSWIPK